MNSQVENYCNISSSYFAIVLNIFNQDFKKLIGLFNEHEVEYILVGGYAVILHGYVRTTGDLDLWLNR